jgi:hypothetical protein
LAGEKAIKTPCAVRSVPLGAAITEPGSTLESIIKAMAKSDRSEAWAKKQQSSIAWLLFVR